MTQDKKKGGTSLGVLICQALKETGLALPETEDEIAAAEAEIAKDKVILPPALQGPWGFLNSSARLSVSPSTAASVVSQEVVNELARAARSGGALTKEIEEQMRKDREEAEVKAESNEER